MIRHNFRYKLLALSIAIVIWFYVNKGYNPNVTREIPAVPLTVRKLGPGLMVTEMPKTVRVTLEGPKEHVNAVAADADEIFAYVNLRGLGQGKHRIPVVVVPPQGYAGIVKATATPREASITVVREARRTLRVEVDFAGTAPVGFRFGSPEFTPSIVTVSGSRDRVSRVSRLTVTVEPSLLREGVIEGDFDVTPRDKDGREVHGVKLDPDRVHLRLSLERVPASRVVFVSPNIVGQPPFTHKVTKIEVQPQTATIIGRPEQLMQISTVITDRVDISNHDQTFTRRVRIIPPAGTSLANGRYARVTVQIVPRSNGTKVAPETESR